MLSSSINNDKNSLVLVKIIVSSSILIFVSSSFEIICASYKGILPAPESSHAIKVAIDEAIKCKETGEEKNIVFGLTGTGYFDMYAYQKFNDGNMSDYIPTDEELAASMAKLPKVEG